MQTLTIRKGWKLHAVNAQRDVCDVYLPLELVGARPRRIAAAVSRSDWWECFEDRDEDGVIFIVSINRSLPYAGLEEWHLHPDGWHPCEERSYFFQEERVSELGNFNNIENSTVVRRLFEFAHDRY